MTNEIPKNRIDTTLSLFQEKIESLPKGSLIYDTSTYKIYAKLNGGLSLISSYSEETEEKTNITSTRAKICERCGATIKPPFNHCDYCDTWYIF